MYPKRFKIAAWFIVANYIVIPLCFLFSIFFLYNAIPRWEYMFRSDIVISVFFALCGIGFAIAGIYSLRMIPRLGDIIVTDKAILQEHPNGTKTQLLWNEKFTIQQHAIPGRLELTSLDEGRMIFIENQIDDFQELSDLIHQKWLENQEHTEG